MTRRAAAMFLAGLTVISGCQRHQPETVPLPTTSSAAPEPPNPIHPGRWSIRPTDEKLEYRSTRVVSLKYAPPTMQSRDSFTTTIDFSITSKKSPSTTAYSAEVQSINSTASQPVLQVPFSFSGHLSDSRLKIDTFNKAPLPSIIDCSNGELSFATVVLQTIITIPPQIETGSTWVDSLTTIACAGPVPGTLSITRTLRTLSSTQINGAEAIIIELDEKTTLTGEGSQEQHRVHLRGTGSGKGRLIIDAATGTVITANTDRLTLLVVMASGREQQFQQHVNETVVRVQ